MPGQNDNMQKQIFMQKQSLQCLEQQRAGCRSQSMSSDVSSLWWPCAK
jgi:hypothetical protein